MNNNHVKILSTVMWEFRHSHYNEVIYPSLDRLQDLSKVYYELQNCSLQPADASKILEVDWTAPSVGVVDTGQYPGLANPYQFFLFSGPDLLGLGSPAQPAPVRQQQQIKVSSSQSCQGGGVRWEYFLSDSLTSHVSVLPSRLIINLLGISQLSTRQNIKATARIIGNGKELFYSALWKTAAAVDVAVST